MENNTAPAETSETNQLTNAPVETSTNPVGEVQTTQGTVNPNTITLTDEQARFFNSNGGIDKVFARMKEAVSNPLPRPQSQNVAQTTPEITRNVSQNIPEMQQNIRPQIPNGYITQEEYATEQYFRSLANDAKYEGIADQIRSGEVLKEMAEFGIRPTDTTNGQLMFNDGQIRKFLDLKAQTIPAKQTVAPITNVPTVEWSNIESVNSFAEAQKIINENLSRPGMEHPKTAEAKEFLRNFYKSK